MQNIGNEPTRDGDGKFFILQLVSWSLNSLGLQHLFHGFPFSGAPNNMEVANESGEDQQALFCKNRKSAPKVSPITLDLIKKGASASVAATTFSSDENFKGNDDNDLRRETSGFAP